MRIDEKTVRDALDKRFSGLTASPALTARIRQRIAREEEPKMKMQIREAKNTLREFFVPQALIDFVDWSSLKSEIAIENHVHDLISTWFEVMDALEVVIPS